MRINKFLAESGVASRRAADKLIEEGSVTVNGKPCTIGQEISDRDTVCVNGKKVARGTKNEYFIMNKPKGYVCTVSDDRGRKTVMDLLPSGIGRVYPIGRLDYESEGLLLFTNDGDLAFRLTHPKNEIPKTYAVKVEGSVSDEQVVTLMRGVLVDGKKTGKCRVAVTESTQNFCKLTITITEGRNRQVRKMFEAIGKNVVFLKRTKIGDLTLRGLDRGSVRKLTPYEVDYLKNL